MDDFERDSVIDSFELLEARLLDFLKHVPPTEQNLGVHSPELASIILDASGLLDSVFREISPDPESVGGAQKHKDDLTMNDYEQLYGSKFDLSNCRSYVLVWPPQVRAPFEEWAHGRHLSWWASQNKLKHSRIRHLRDATLKITLESMCALHMVLSLVPDFADAILRKHWFKTKIGSPGQALAVLRGDPGWGGIPFLVGTRLFLLGRGRDGRLPAKVNDFDLDRYHPEDSVLDFFATLTNR